MHAPLWAIILTLATWGTNKAAPAIYNDTPVKAAKWLCVHKNQCDQYNAYAGLAAQPVAPAGLDSGAKP